MNVVTSGLVKLGTLTRVHGVRGAFVVQTSSGKDSVLNQIKTLQIGSSEENTNTFTITEAAWMPSGWKVVCKEITTIEQATALIGQSIFVAATDLPATNEKEYYERDLIGLPAYHFETKELFGTYLYSEPVGETNRFEQDRWWFKTPLGELSIPATKRYLEKVDIQNKAIWLKNLADFKDSDDDT